MLLDTSWTRGLSRVEEWDVRTKIETVVGDGSHVFRCSQFPGMRGEGSIFPSCEEQRDKLELPQTSMTAGPPLHVVLGRRQGFQQ